MKNDIKPQIKKPQLTDLNPTDLNPTDLNPTDLRSVTGGQNVGSLDMVQSAARTCFCAKTGVC